MRAKQFVCGLLAGIVAAVVAVVALFGRKEPENREGKLSARNPNKDEDAKKADAIKAARDRLTQIVLIGVLLSFFGGMAFAVSDWVPPSKKDDFQYLMTMTSEYEAVLRSDVLVRKVKYDKNILIVTFARYTVESEVKFEFPKNLVITDCLDEGIGRLKIKFKDYQEPGIAWLEIAGSLLVGLLIGILL